MFTLTHFRICPHSRAIRLVLGELGIDHELEEERPWEWRREFLALNPAGELPVLTADGIVICGASVIAEYLAETAVRNDDAGKSRTELLPGDATARAEVRRLTQWFLGKFDREVSRELLTEKVYGTLQPGSGHAPDAAVLRAVRSNLRYHMSYINHLANERRWLAGEDLSFADFAAAAHLSAVDYLAEIPWENYPVAKSWYMRMKSRPAMRPLLADKLAGIAPASWYAELDF
jgi:glutathione S-transferase